MNIFGGDMTEEELKILGGDLPEDEELETELGTLGEKAEEVEEAVEEEAEEVVEEPATEAPVIPEEPKPDAAAFARLRWEAKQAREEAERLKQAQTKTEPEEQTFDQVIGALINEVQTLKQQVSYREVETSARQEFAAYEQAAQAKLPDYDDAAEHMTKELRRSFSLVNPGATPQQITKLCDDYVLKRAAFALEQGIQPAEYLHHVAYKEFGFQPQREASSKEERKPDLSKLAANRKKSAGMAAAGGRGSEPSLTAEAALDMDNAAFSRLSPAEIDKLLASIN